MGFIQFSDVVQLHMYDSRNQFIGYLSCNQQGQCRATNNVNEAVNFCVTPHRFFAEDLELRDTTIRGTPMTLQQLTWIPGLVWSNERCILKSYAGKPILEPLDVTNVTDRAAIVYMYEMNSPNVCMNPVYKQRYYMTLGDDSRFLSLVGSSIDTSQSPIPHGVSVSMHFVATIGEDQAKNHPHSQAYQPYATLPSQCSRSCTKCTK